MSSWPSVKARRVFPALKRIGWRHDRTVGSHKIMKKDGWAARRAFNPKTCEGAAHADRRSVLGDKSFNEFLHVGSRQTRPVNRIGGQSRITAVSAE